MLRLCIVGSSVAFFMILTLLELSQVILTVTYSIHQALQKCLSKDGAKMSASKINYNSQFIVSNIQMFIVLVASITYGLMFGYIQASNDPENHKCFFAIVFSVSYEIRESQPIGMGLGVFFTMMIEYLRQMEKMHRSAGKNALDLSLKSGSTPELHNYDEDEEKISLVNY